MTSQPNRDQIIWPNPSSTGLRSEVCAILFLLNSAEASLPPLIADDGCVAILKACISRIQQRHHLTDHEISEGIVWNESSIDALVRLLDYVRAEVREKLNDQQSAEEIGLCIDRLMSPNKLCWGN